MIIEIFCCFFAIARVRVPEAVMARRLVSMIAAIAYALTQSSSSRMRLPACTSWLICIVDFRRGVGKRYGGRTSE